MQENFFNMTKHILSKSTFMYGCQCPLRLYLHKFKPELRNEEDEAEQATFAMGTNVGLLAQNYFPGGIDASPPDSFSYHISVERTKKLINDGVKIIYEAAFNFKGILCAVDLLVKKEGKWKAYEVKSTVNLKPTHIMDASLQYYVLTNAGLELEDFYILNLNRDYVRRGELDIQTLFKPTSVLKEIVNNQIFIASKAQELLQMIQSKVEPIVTVGAQCENPYPCDFSNHCWKGIEEIDEEKNLGEISINKEGITKFINELQYPLFFFDFETVAHPVPLYNESRPYQHVPFQYSLHIQVKKGAEIEHEYFLGDGVNDPREELIKKMLADFGSTGTILVWYKPFESSKLANLERDFPVYEKELNALQVRIIDLMVPFKSKMYQHPDFGGSASIKKVMPVLIPELSYGELEVQDGMMATTIYAGLKEKSVGEQERLKEGLLAYCHLDTLAMVKIYNKLVEKIQNHD